MKSIKEIINESKIKLDNGNTVEVEILVKKDKDSNSQNMYNLNGINNAVNDAQERGWDLFFKVTNAGKTFISQSLREAIDKVSE